MTAGLVAVLVLRGREAHKAPALPVAEQPSASTSGDQPLPKAGTTTGAAASGAAAQASVAGSGHPSATATGASKPTMTLGRPLRVIALGWDLLAPGILVNDGASPGKNSAYKAKGLEVELNATREIGKVENALARGGSDEKGADIALLPLQRFAASYERLRALQPVIFFVVGWSQGREVVISETPSFAKLPKRGKLRMRAAAGDAACFVGLFGLELSGFDLARVKLVDRKANRYELSAVTRSFAKKDSEQASGSVLLTTGDASRLVPFVAVAQSSLLDKQATELKTWARVWLDGHRRVAADATAAARTIAAVKSAPEPLTILSRLGEIAPASLADNARAVALAGRGAVTLDSLFDRAWKTWRHAKVLSIPPERAPIDTRIIAALVRAEPELVVGEAAADVEVAPATKKPAKDAAKAKTKGGQALIVYHAPAGKLNEDELVSTVGFLAGVFRRSPLQISVFRGYAVDSKATQKLIERVAQRYGIVTGRMSPGKGRPQGRSPATIRVLPIP